MASFGGHAETLLDQRGQVLLCHVRWPAHIHRLVDDLGARLHLHRKLRHVGHRDLVGHTPAVAKARRDALLANPLGEERVDPDVHEGRRPQHHVR